MFLLSAFAGFSLLQLLGFFPDDETQDDWIRENEKLFTGFNPYGMYFEGYDQYDVNGDSVYHFIFTNHLDLKLGIEVQ